MLWTKVPGKCGFIESKPNMATTYFVFPSPYLVTGNWFWRCMAHGVPTKEGKASSMKKAKMKCEQHYRGSDSSDDESADFVDFKDEVCVALKIFTGTNKHLVISEIEKLVAMRDAFKAAIQLATGTEGECDD